MSNPIGKDDQLVIILNQKQQFRGGTWKGSIEIDGGREYSFAEIMVLANDDPSTIIAIYKLSNFGDMSDITEAVLNWVDANP